MLLSIRWTEHVACMGNMERSHIFLVAEPAKTDHFNDIGCQRNRVDSRPIHVASFEYGYESCSTKCGEFPDCLSYGEFDIVGRSCPSAHTFVLKPALHATGQTKLIIVASKQHVLHGKQIQHSACLCHRSYSSYKMRWPALRHCTLIALIPTTFIWINTFNVVYI